MTSPLDRGTLVSRSLFAITPADTPLTSPIRALKQRADGVAGTVRYVDDLGVTQNTYISPGEVLYTVMTTVNLTGTTATKLEGYL